MNLSRRCILGASASAMLVVSAASGQSAQQFTFALPAQPLAASLKAVTRTGGVDLFATTGDIAGRQAPALNGRYTLQEALAALLAGSGLNAELSGTRVFIRPLGSGAEPVPTPAIVVTGSRIRGAVVASPVIALTQSDIVASGQTTLGEAVRTLPQNFGGGQNPGIVGLGDQAGNTNLNSSSTINLRGLGPDATLTLLNGHRIAYDAGIQGIDVDAIPLAALDRIEIVADGASALYGSDAVGGVANIILKRDFDGLTLSGRVGGTTDGGGAQQEYSAVTGRRWNGGGLLAAFDYSRTTSITAADRSYTRPLSGDQTLDPAIRHVDGVLTGHQQIGPATLSFDAFYSHRTSASNDPFTATAPVMVSGLVDHVRQTSYEISPRLDLPLGSAWRAYLTGTYGQDRSRNHDGYYFSSVRALDQLLVYNNHFSAVEVGADGPLLRIFGQTVRVAIGGGYRFNRLGVASIFNGVDLSPIAAHQSTYYAFGEASVPLVSPATGIPGVHSLSVSAALRFEDYPGIDRITTPKFGLIYNPVADVALKASWGRSFKAPTLYQLNRQDDGTAIPANLLGTSPLPTTSNVLEWTGGNPDLKPERATSWTVTAEWKPSRAPGAALSLSYFHTRYTQRVIEPITSIDGVFADSRFQSLITYSPSPEFLDAIAATVPAGIQTYFGDPYDPSTVSAVVDDRYHNVAKQLIQGIDAEAQYLVTLGSGRTITATGSASYLRSRQQLGPDQSLTPLSGQLFYMPKWKARGGLTYASDSFGVTADVTYIGGLRDERFAPSVPVGSVVPIDLTGVYHVRSRSRLLDKIDLLLTVQNLFNAKPGRIRTTNPNSPAYDSSNYSSIGRFISFTLTKAF